VTVTAEQMTLEDLGSNKVRVTIVQAEGGPTAENITAAAEQPVFLTRMAVELGVAEVSFALPPATIAVTVAPPPPLSSPPLSPPSASPSTQPLYYCEALCEFGDYYDGWLKLPMVYPELAGGPSGDYTSCGNNWKNLEQNEKDDHEAGLFNFTNCEAKVPPATCQAACAGVGGYDQVTHSDGIMYDCYEAPAAATDGPFASSVVDNMYLLWVFPATLAELATAASSTSTLLGSMGIHTNLSEVVPYAHLSSKLDGMIRRDGGSFVETGCRFGEYKGPGATYTEPDGSIVTPNSDYKCTDNDQQGCTNKETLWLQWVWPEEPFSYAPDAGVAILASVQNPVAIRPDSKWTFAADSPAGSTLYRGG